MTSSYTSKHGAVLKRPEELYMLFCDMRNFGNMVPEQYKECVTADYDNISISYQGVTISVRVDERVPYSIIRLGSAQSPVEFVAALHFDPATEPGRTDFYIRLDANLNFMMKAMIGGKIQQGLDKIVDSLVMVSEGRMPEMPKDFKF